MISMFHTFLPRPTVSSSLHMTDHALIYRPSNCSSSAVFPTVEVGRQNVRSLTKWLAHQQVGISLGSSMIHILLESKLAAYPIYLCR